MREIRTADRGHIRDVNMLAVIEALTELGATTRAAIARETGLSAPTVSALVSELAEAGLVTMAGSGPVTGGRRGEQLILRAGSRLVLSIDLSTSPPRQALVDLAGNIVAGSTEELSASAVQSPESFVRWVARRMGSLSDVIGIGVAVPGVIDWPTGIIEWAPSLGWRDVRLRAELEASVPGTVGVVDNDLNLASLAEHAFAEERVSDLVMLGLRGGLGAGVILGGRLHRGVHFAAGEIGYLPVGPGSYGSRDFGALEAALFAQLREPGQETADDAPPDAGPDIVSLLSFACLSVAALLDVAVIVLSEEILGYGTDPAAHLGRVLAEVLPHSPAVLPSRLGADGSLRGAAVAVHNEVRQDIRRLLG
jgi:DNA-binding transcriptional ArsR family regulator